MTDVPAWAAKAIRSEIGDEPITSFRVLKESPFSKIVVGYTPTRAVVAERGFFGAVAWQVGEASPSPFASEAMPQPSEAPAPRYQGPTEVEEQIEGIGATYAKKLFAERVETIAQLVAADTATLAEATGISATHIAKWQNMGRLQAIHGIGKQYSELLVRGGVASIAELAACTPDDLAARLQKYQEGLDSSVQGNPITGGLVAQWIEAARASM